LKIAEKETNLGPDDQLISVCHFRQNKPLEGTSQNQLVRTIVLYIYTVNIFLA
jgi:hypothetical protein